MRLAWCITLSRPTLVAVLSGLPLLSGLSLVTLLSRLVRLLALLSLLRLARLIPRLPPSIPFLTLAVLCLRELLHAIAHAFHLRQGLFNIPFIAGAFAGLAVFLKRSLSLLQLIAQLIETHCHGGLANPGGHSLPLPQPLGALAHAKLH